MSGRVYDPWIGPFLTAWCWLYDTRVGVSTPCWGGIDQGDKRFSTQSVVVVYVCTDSDPSTEPYSPRVALARMNPRMEFLHRAERYRPGGVLFFLPDLLKLSMYSMIHDARIILYSSRVVLALRNLG